MARTSFPVSYEVVGSQHRQRAGAPKSLVPVHELRAEDRSDRERSMNNRRTVTVDGEVLTIAVDESSPVAEHWWAIASGRTAGRDHGGAAGGCAQRTAHRAAHRYQLRRRRHVLFWWHGRGCDFPPLFAPNYGVHLNLAAEGYAPARMVAHHGAEQPAHDRRAGTGSRSDGSDPERQPPLSRPDKRILVGPAGMPRRNGAASEISVPASTSSRSTPGWTRARGLGAPRRRRRVEAGGRGLTRSAPRAR